MPLGITPDSIGGKGGTRTLDPGIMSDFRIFLHLVGAPLGAISCTEHNLAGHTLNTATPRGRTRVETNEGAARRSL